MPSTALWFMKAALNVTKLSVWLPKAMYIKRMHGPAAAYEYAALRTRRVCENMLRAAGTEITVTGEKYAPGDIRIFAPVHSGLFDAPVMCVCTENSAFAMKKELSSIIFVKRWLTLADCVFIDRKNPAKAKLSIDSAADTLRHGHSLIIFPEGTRSKTGMPGRVKTGIFRISAQCSVPIVPVIIDGTADAYEKHKRINKAHVSVKFLPELKLPENTSHNSLRELTDSLSDLYARELILMREENRKVE